METHINTIGGSYDVFKEIIVLVIPIILLIYFGASLIHTFKKEQATIRNFSESHVKDGSQVTLMTIVVAVVVILCQVPWLVEKLLIYFGIYMTSFLSTISHFFKAINAAVNFLIYSLCRKYFRQKLRVLCSSCRIQCESRTFSWT